MADVRNDTVACRLLVMYRCCDNNNNHVTVCRGDVMPTNGGNLRNNNVFQTNDRQPDAVTRINACCVRQRQYVYSWHANMPPLNQ